MCEKEIPVWMIVCVVALLVHAYVVKKNLEFQAEELKIKYCNCEGKNE